MFRSADLVMLGKLSGRQEENIVLRAFQWKSSLFNLQLKLYLSGITVVKQILVLLDSDAEH